MNPSLCIRLSLPADERFLALVQAHIREIAGVVLLPHKEVLGLELAVEEAFTNVIEHAYPDSPPRDVSLETEIGPMELVLSVIDEGIPFYPTLEEEARPPSGDYELPLHHFGLQIIRHEVDEARFENLGPKGKALRLVKHLPRPMEIGSEKAFPETETAPHQNYEIRPMLLKDAIQVPKLFWLAYGYSYRNEFYRPEDLMHMVECGRMISYVAVAENGEVVGHAGLMRTEPLQIAEKAFLAVSPAHRGRGIMDALSMAVEAKALQIGLCGISANPVTSHDISQRDVVHRGYKACGLELAAAKPPQFKAIKREGDSTQRESLMHYFKYLSPPPLAVAHVPPRHQSMVARIYDNLGQACLIGHLAPSVSPGDYQINFDRNQKKGHIRIISADPNQWPLILRAAEDLEKFGEAEVVDLDIPLAQPASALVCEMAERSGFFFAGLRPCEAQDGDSLRLQRLSIPLDVSRLCIYSDFAADLFEYVKSRMEEARTWRREAPPAS